MNEGKNGGRTNWQKWWQAWLRAAAMSVASCLADPAWLASSASVAARPTRGDDVLEDHGGSILCPRAGHSAPTRPTAIGRNGLPARSTGGSTTPNFEMKPGSNV